MAELILSRHAQEQMYLRGIPVSIVNDVIKRTDNVLVLNGKKVYQAIVNFRDGRYLVRVFVNMDKDPNVIITVYRTSKINKYYES